MKIYRSLAEMPPDFGPCALTIGNFDGVHFGHRRILRRVKAVADERGWKASVLTFHPHPTRGAGGSQFSVWASTRGQRRAAATARAAVRLRNDHRAGSGVAGARGEQQ